MCQGLNLSAITSLYIVSRLLQIVGGKSIVNSVAGVILYPYMSLSVRDASEWGPDNSLFIFNDIEKLVHSGSKSEGAENINGNPLHGHLPECISSNSYFVGCPVDDNVCPERFVDLNVISVLVLLMQIRVSYINEERDVFCFLD